MLTCWRHSQENNNPDGSDERERKEYEDLISHSLFDGQNQKRVLSFSPKKTARIDGFENGLREVRLLAETEP